MPTRSTVAKRQEAHGTASAKSPARPAPVSYGTGTGGHSGFDRLIYERVRLGIMSALATNEELTFNELKSLFNASDGNLGRTPASSRRRATWRAPNPSRRGARNRSTASRPLGRKALLRYLEHIEAVIKATRRVCSPHARRNHHGRKRPLGHRSAGCRAPRATSKAQRPCAPRSRSPRARQSTP